MCARARHQAIRAAALVGAALLLLDRNAEAAPEAVRIEYAAPADCPDAATFLRWLRDRTTRFREAAPGEETRRFVVRVTAVGSSFDGRLEIHSPDGSSATRSLDGPICDELTDALALMTALVIDPDARVKTQKPSSPADADARPVPEPKTTVIVEPPAAATSPTPPWRWFVGLQGQTTLGRSPNMGWGGQLFVEAEAPAASALGSSVRAGLGYEETQVDATSPAGVSARFQWMTASLEGCPVRWASRELRWAAYPCVAFDAGILRGRADGISRPRQAVSFWSDAGPSLRLRVMVTAGLSLEARGALLVTLTRPTFDILDVASGTTTATYTPAAVGGTLALGAAYRFW